MRRSLRILWHKETQIRMMVQPKYKFENEKNSLLTLWVRLQLVNENWRIWLKRWVRSILRCKTRNKRSFFQGGTASSFRFTRSPMRSGGLVNLENLNCYECLSLPSLPEGMSVFSDSCSCELPGQSLNHPTSRFSFLHYSKAPTSLKELNCFGCKNLV